MESEILDDNNFREIKNVQYANFGSRLGASLLDFLITIIPIGALMYFGYAGQDIMFLILAVLIGMLYKPLMEGIWGATLGKMIVGITMVDSDFEQIDLGKSFLKNGIYIISSVISLLSMFWLGGTEGFQEAEGALEAMASGQESPYGIVSMVWSFFIFVSCMLMLASIKTKQTLHDRIANTYCVNNSSLEYID